MLCRGYSSGNGKAGEAWWVKHVNWDGKPFYQDCSAGLFARSSLRSARRSCTRARILDSLKSKVEGKDDDASWYWAAEGEWLPALVAALGPQAKLNSGETLLPKVDVEGEAETEVRQKQDRGRDEGNVEQLKEKDKDKDKDEDKSCVHAASPCPQGSALRDCGAVPVQIAADAAVYAESSGEAALQIIVALDREDHKHKEMGGKKRRDDGHALLFPEETFSAEVATKARDGLDHGKAEPRRWRR